MSEKNARKGARREGRHLPVQMPTSVLCPREWHQTEEKQTGGQRRDNPDTDLREARHQG